MVTRLEPSVYETHEYVGLSTDTKPIDFVPNGSTFIEMDTKKLFAFNEENLEWLEQ